MFPNILKVFFFLYLTMNQAMKTYLVLN